MVAYTTGIAEQTAFPQRIACSPWIHCRKSPPKAMVAYTPGIVEHAAFQKLRRAMVTIYISQPVSPGEAQDFTAAV